MLHFFLGSPLPELCSCFSQLTTVKSISSFKYQSQLKFVLNWSHETKNCKCIKAHDFYAHFSMYMIYSFVAHLFFTIILDHAVKKRPCVSIAFLCQNPFYLVTMCSSMFAIVDISLTFFHSSGFIIFFILLLISIILGTQLSNLFIALMFDRFSFFNPIHYLICLIAWPFSIAIVMQCLHRFKSLTIIIFLFLRLYLMAFDRHLIAIDVTICS